MNEAKRSIGKRNTKGSYYQPNKNIFFKYDLEMLAFQGCKIKLHTLYTVLIP